ncbi:MAG: ExeM/NucH family extracellular endonuclease [Gammaproteobacteria bacterium]|nr:ExeM/NucH family extracellular endonuclease [Gammaproteobacteria bacterium]
MMSLATRLLAGLSLLLIAAAANAALISEIRIDQPSTDNDEYFELVGEPQESLAGLSYIVIGDGAGGSGVIEAIVDLSSQSLDSSGLFVAAEGTFTLGTANLTTSLNFENSDNVTHLLVEGFVGTLQQDLDIDDDGVQDVIPWTSVIDSVALVENLLNGEQVYSETQIGPDGTFVPAHVFRCGGTFEIGVFDPADAESLDTPGAANPCESDLLLSEIRIDQPSSDNDEYFELTGSPNLSLDGVTYLVIGDGTGGSGTIEAVVDLTGSVVPANGLFVVAESTFSLATADLTASLNFENSDNVTHLLVRDFTGANADDLDTNDDGVLDIEPWSELIDSLALVEDLNNGELVYSSNQIGPDGSFVPGHVFRCDTGFEIGVFDPNGGVDTPGEVNACTGGPVATPATIPEIQGSGDVSPLLGQQVITSGVVVADFQGNDQLRGFFLQDPVGDSDPATSDGVFVFDPDGVDVQVGDELTIVADVDEFFGQTELENVASIEITGTGQIASTAVFLPEASNGDLERYEGMLVEIIGDITVSQNFFLGRYGQMTLSSANDNDVPGRLFQPTNEFPANSPQALALAEENARRILILDDGQDISRFGDNPVPVPYIGGPPPSVIRAGDSVTNLIGVLDFGRINSANPPANDYRLHPTVEPVFFSSNPREFVPASTAGRITVASYNVLNYFNTIDQGDNRGTCGPNGDQGCRGADSDSEFARQQAKIVNAIVAMEVDVLGLVELENNGNGADSAIQNLVNAVNAILGEGTYAIASISDAPLGGDAIAVGMIYKPESVTPVGTAATLASGAFDQNLAQGRSRAPLMVSFEENETQEQFSVIVNHLKSKGSPPEDINDPNFDQADGQGNWNARRTEAANDLAAWIATNPTGIDDPDVMIIGDLNAYAKEDPILALQDQGYVDLIAEFNGAERYSFTFDGQAGYLDHAIGNSSLIDQITGVVEWHINTDEPAVIDYNEEFNPEGYYDQQPFRSSDHDPVIVGLDLFTPISDADDDGVADEDDQCADTNEGDLAAENGCSVQQSIELNCSALLPNKTLRYIRCGFREIRVGLRRDLITLREARRLTRKVIKTAFRARHRR